MRKQFLGVSIAVKDADVADLTDGEQDVFIREVATKMAPMLREYVKDTPPLSGTDLVFDVTGPHDDPLQGHIHVHTLSGWFDIDAIPTDAPAYLVWRDGQTPQGPQVQGPTRG